jgi:hypothetical protein
MIGFAGIVADRAVAGLSPWLRRWSLGSRYTDRAKQLAQRGNRIGTGLLGLVGHADSARRIDELYFCRLEVPLVERCQREVVRECSGGDQAVFDRHRLAAVAEISEQLGPAHADGGIPRQALDPPDPLLEPAFKLGAPPTACQKKDAEADLTQDDWIDDDRALVASQPLDDAGVGFGLGRLREDVGVDEVSHSVSVDSESTATK